MAVESARKDANEGLHRAILWDIDGVLVNSEPLHREKIEKIAATPPGGGPGVIIAKTDWDELHGRGDYYIYDWIKASQPDYPLGKQEFLDACGAYYLANASKLKARPGALDAFNMAAAQGCRQAAVSSGVRAQVDANLNAVDLTARMEFAMSADDSQKTKPDPEPLNIAFSRMAATQPDLQRSECVYIGDALSDCEAGHAAGMTTIYWKLDTDQKDSSFADFTVTGQKDLAALVHRLAVPALN